ncbi:MAG: site-specific integrase, partial [Acidobacteria bacterium]|nr:site-specific integrase [Acidobacteriota bacterium]
MTSDFGTAEDICKLAFWLRYPPRGRRLTGETTIASYVYTVRRFHRFLAGREPSQEGVERFVHQLEVVGNSPRSIGRHISALRSYFA